MWMVCCLARLVGRLVLLLLLLFCHRRAPKREAEWGKGHTPDRERSRRKGWSVGWTTKPPPPASASSGAPLSRLFFFSYDLFLLFFRGPAHTLTLRERESSLPGPTRPQTRGRAASSGVCAAASLGLSREWGKQLLSVASALLSRPRRPPPRPRRRRRCRSSSCFSSSSSVASSPLLWERAPLLSSQVLSSSFSSSSFPHFRATIDNIHVRKDQICWKIVVLTAVCKTRIFNISIINRRMSKLFIYVLCRETCLPAYETPPSSPPAFCSTRQHPQMALQSARGKTPSDDPNASAP